jgi:hypothetical protein
MAVGTEGVQRVLFVAQPGVPFDVAHYREVLCYKRTGTVLVPVRLSLLLFLRVPKGSVALSNTHRLCST